MKFRTILIITILLFVVLYLFSILFLASYESTYDESTHGEFYSTGGMKTMEVIAFYVYKYILNFPLSIFSWFTNSLLHLTTYFFIPNAVVLALIIKYIKKKM